MDKQCNDSFRQNRDALAIRRGGSLPKVCCYALTSRSFTYLIWLHILLLAGGTPPGRPGCDILC